MFLGQKCRKKFQKSSEIEKNENCKKTADIPSQIERKLTKNELPLVDLIFFHYKTQKCCKLNLV